MRRRWIDREERGRLRHLLVAVLGDLEEPARIPLREGAEEEVARRPVGAADQPPVRRGRPDERGRGDEPEGDANRDERRGGPEQGCQRCRTSVRRRRSARSRAVLLRVMFRRASRGRSAARPGSSTLRCSSPARAAACSALDLDAGDRAARREEIDHGRLDAGADIEDAPGLSDRGERRRRDVAHVDVVARLPAVAEDLRCTRLPRSRPKKIATTPASPCGVLPRAVDVAEPKRDMLRPVQAVIGREVLLATELGRAVRRERLARRRPRARESCARRRSRLRSS